MHHDAAVFGAIAGLVSAAVFLTVILIGLTVRAAWKRWHRHMPAVRALRSLAPVQTWKDRK